MGKIVNQPGHKCVHATTAQLSCDVPIIRSDHNHAALEQKAFEQDFNKIITKFQ